jgi:hypothetical protein
VTPTWAARPCSASSTPTALDHDGGPLVEYYAPAAIFAIRPCSPEAAETASRYWIPLRPQPRAELEFPAELAELVDEEQPADPFGEHYDDELDDEDRPF